MTKLIVDSGCDLSPELCSRYGIEVVQLKVSLEGKTYNDWELSPDSLYDELKNGKIAITSAPPPEDFRRVYEKVLLDDDSAVVLTLPSQLSGTYDSARIAAEEFNNIEVIDSKTASVGLGLAVIKTSELLKEYQKKIGEYLRQHMLDRIRVYASLEDLSQLRRSGRINLAQFALGSLLKIYPVISLKEGKAEPVARVRSYRQAIEKIINFIEEDIYHFKPNIVHFMPMHGAVPERIEELRYRVSELLEKIKVRINQFTTGRIGSVIGAHAGPTVYGVGLLYE